MKKKFRDITVDGQKYAWSISHPNCDGDGGIKFKIWKDKKVVYEGYEEGGYGHPDITPAYISNIIEGVGL